MQQSKEQSNQSSGQKNFQTQSTVPKPSPKEYVADQKTKKEEQEGTETPREVPDVQAGTATPKTR